MRTSIKETLRMVILFSVVMASGVSAATLGNNYIFASGDADHGQELWISDGTAGGTQLLKDINPGTDGSYPANFVTFNNQLFFVADDGVHGRELWKTDGTSSGTALVSDLLSGGDGSNPSSFVVSGSKLFFIANGTDLWVYDGTNATYIGTFDITPRNLTDVNGVLYFVATTASEGEELWKSDGTSNGTVLVKDILGGAGSSHPDDLCNVNGVLYFSADDGQNGRELWKSDGTSGGTVMVKNIVSGAAGSSPSNFCAFGGKLFFSCDDGTHGAELWTSDGTDAGTVLVKDVASGADGSAPMDLTVCNNRLFFTAFTTDKGGELWSTDGTAANTALVADINSGANSSAPSQLFPVGNNLFFTATDGTHGSELYVTDGTTATLLKDINGTAADTNIQAMSNVGGQLFFIASPSSGVLQLWKSDGTSNGTVKITDLISLNLTTVTLSPATAALGFGVTLQLTPSYLDQYGHTMNRTTFLAQTDFSVSGGGTISPSGLFQAGTQAGGPFTVTATCLGISGTASVTVSGARYRLVTDSDPSDGGTFALSPAPDVEGYYPAGTVVQITAQPATGYYFGSWSGAASGTNAVTTVTMDANKSVNASFYLRYTLTLSATNGSVSASPVPDANNTYEPQTSVTLTATPNAGYTFDRWSGSVTDFGNPVTFTIDANSSVTASFQDVTYRPTLSLSTTHGTLTANPPPDGDGKYSIGRTVTLTAVPDAGYVFASWAGDLSGTATSMQIVMRGDRSVAANFVIGYSLTLTTNPTDGGTITSNPLPNSDGLYPTDATVSLTANPKPNYFFDRWSGAAIGAASPIYITITENTSVTASFSTSGRRVKLTTSVTPTDYGTVTVQPAPDGDGMYAAGTVVKLTAVPAQGKLFDSWAGDVFSSENPVQLTLGGDRSVTAGFFIGAPPSVSSVTPNAGASGTKITIVGSAFHAGATVTFGTAQATDVQLIDSTQLSCTCPVPGLNSPSTVDVIVTNTDGQSGTLAGGFTYTFSTPPTIRSVRATVNGTDVSAVLQGTSVTFIADAIGPNGDTLSYSWDFQDGSTATGNNIAHTYGPKTPTTPLKIVLTVRGGGGTAQGTVALKVLAPSSGGVGVLNLGDETHVVVVNPVSKMSVNIARSNGGAIEFVVDTTSLVRAATLDVSTSFKLQPGMAVSDAVQSGYRPAAKFSNCGVVVVESTATDTATKVIVGTARRTVALSALETDDVNVTLKLPKPSSSKVKVTGLTGKFTFSGKKDSALDSVSVRSSVALPAGMELGKPQVLSVGLGNVVDSISISAKGSPTAKKGTDGILQKVKVKYPKLAKGKTTTAGTESAQISFTFSAKDLDRAGFDTDGITNNIAASEKGQKSITRSVQLVYVFGGVAYETLVNVNFGLKTSKNGDTGTLKQK